MALGACLAAFYLLPAIYEQRWIDIAQAVSAGSRPADNFLFIHTTRRRSRRVQPHCLLVRGSGDGGDCLAAWAARWWRETQRELWNVLVAWAIACSVLMFPVAALLWKVLPKMQFMQFPWRWLLCLSMIFSLLVTVGLRRWWWRAAIIAVSILVIVGAWRYAQAPWWDTAAICARCRTTWRRARDTRGRTNTRRWGRSRGRSTNEARNVTVDGPAHAAIHVQRWDAESRIFTAEMSAADQVAVRLFRYPAWRVEVNGRVVETAARAETGQMLVPVEAGMNRVQIRFVRTWDRTAGGWISLITAISVMALDPDEPRQACRSQTPDLDWLESRVFPRRQQIA